MYHFDVAKRAGGLGLALPARDPDVPVGRWFYGAVRGAILRGQLRPGVRLPSTRELARLYGMARGTVVNAFAQLASEGYIDGAIGSGTYVSAVLPEHLLQVDEPVPRRAAAPRGARSLSAYASRVRGFRPFAGPPNRAFRPNTPALDQFPTAEWAQLASRRLRRASASLLLGCASIGYAPLREAIAGYLATSRGVSCQPDQVVIVSGVQEALDVVARLVLDPGESVYMEEPGYPGASVLFEAFGARVVAAPVDAEGIVLSRSRMRGARLVYVTPAHQCPLGVAMSLPRRLALLGWARETGALVFEDDYDSEYRYSGRPISALQGLDRAGLVLFASSFSKVLFPSLRLGYLVVPPDLVDRFAAARSLINRHPPMLEQMVVCDFITGGHLGRHLRRMRQLYAERLSVLMDCGRRQLAGLLEISPIEAGLQTVGWLADGIAGEEAAEAARQRNVEVVPLRRFHRAAMARDGLQLGFAAVNPREIRRGVDELARILDRLRRSRARSSTGS
jgi:GntR family transcriptional regulator / MocR family aminotransferase